MSKNYCNEQLENALKQIILQLAKDNGETFENFYAEIQDDIEKGLETFGLSTDKCYPGTLDQLTFWQGLQSYSKQLPPTPEEYILFGAGFLVSKSLVCAGNL